MPRHDNSDIEETDDDDMPPLVEAPPSMPYQYTFCTGMTPLSFEFSSSEPNANTIVSYTPAQPTASIEELESFVPGPTRTSHTKRRNASYIPRPPNAFILFRSSFIREQKVTGRVEGNHSNLSKIVGMYWKSLPKSERKTWEAKAEQAQHDHRRRYPDWRFSPGANAAANARVRHQILDPGGGGGGRKRRGSTSIRGAKDPPDRDGSWNNNEDEDEDDGMEVVDDDDDSDYEDTPSRRGKARRKGKGKGKGRAKARSVRGRLTRGRASASRSGKVSLDARKVDRAAAVETDKENDKQWEKERIVKIVDFLMQGKKGNELERAVDEWERGEASSSTDETLQPKDESSPAPPLIVTVNPAPPSLASSRTSTPAPTPTLTHSSVLSPCSPPQPLSPEVGTTMNMHGVKRSLSAPATEQRFVQVDEGRKRHRLSTSVGVEVHGGNQERQLQRRETVSPSYARKLDRGYGYAGEYSYGGIQRSQTFPPMDLVNHTGFEMQRSIVVGSEGYTNAAFGANTNTISANAWYYYPTPTTPISTSTWYNQLQQGPAYAANWWPSHVPVTATTTQSRLYNYEPVREGSFDCVEGGYEEVRGTVYAEMQSRYIEASPSSASASEEWATVAPTPTTEFETHPIPAYNTYPSQTQTQTPTQETPHAGGFFCPPAPSPLPASTFSSLTGWDGKAVGGHQVGQGQQRQGQEPWFGWGSVQRLGLGGGSGSGETT